MTTYAMTDLKQEIDELRSHGVYIDKLEHGSYWDARGRLGLPTGHLIVVGAQRLNAHCDYAASQLHAEYDVPAHAYYAGLGGRWLIGHEIQHCLIGSVGTISCEGKMTVNVPGVSWRSGAVSGTGLYLAVEVLVEQEERAGFSPYLAIGYRRAKISDVSVADERISTPTGQWYALDYSGVFGRLGIRLRAS